MHQLKFLNQSSLFSLIFYRVIQTAFLVTLIGTGCADQPDKTDTNTSTEKQKQETQVDSQIDVGSQIAEIKKQWQKLKGEIRTASAQSKEDLQTELNRLNTEWKSLLEDQQKLYKEQYDSAGKDLLEHWKKMKESKEAAKANLSKDIDRLRREWNDSFLSLKESYSEQIQKLRDELTVLEKQAAENKEKITKKLIEKRATIRQRYTEEVKQLRQGYENFLDSLAEEISRLKSQAKTASTETKANLMGQIDQLNAQSNKQYEELRTLTQEINKRSHAYFDQTVQMIQKSNKGASEKLKSELGKIAQSTTDFNTKMISQTEAFMAKLDQQISNLETRITEAKSETKTGLQNRQSELQVQRKQLQKELTAEYESAMLTMQKEMDQLKAEAKTASGKTKKQLIKGIDYLQTQLEMLKQKLENKP